ncbi:MAG: hypothetical protein IKE74_01735 [Mogibacterium sp.]|nr:hypothetical protein [Mogibacterium sp.]
MNNRNINAIISIASVVIMLIWGTLAGSYRHAWIAVFIGGVLITCLSLYNKGRADTDKADTDKAGGNGGESSKGENDPAEK